MRALRFVIAVLLLAAPAAAHVTFVSPLRGAQAIGVVPLEITTDAADVDRVEFSIDGVLAGVARKPPYRVMHDFGRSLAPHEITARVFSNAYRTSETANVLTSGATANESMTVDLVEVPMHVRSARPLQPADVRVTENGIDQTVREIRSDRGAARFVFVVDRSLSMGDGKLDAALKAIDAETKLLRPADHAEIVLFNHVVDVPRPLSRGSGAEELLGNTEPSGGTSLRDAVASVASHDRTYAIAITDGGDRNSLLTEEEALRKISGAKTIVDSILLGGRSKFLLRAADMTGGTAVNASAETLDRELHRILLDINSRYTLTYQSHGNGPGWRAIAIRTRSRGIEIVNARKGYFAE